MFIDPLSAIILVTPLLMPAMRSFNIDPVFMGVILTVNLGIGYITPPLGANLFIASMVMKESFIKVTYSVIPMLIIYLIALVILNIFPAIIMALPKLLL
jgi:C4-dicarboxylate transporter DctM subunit